MKGFLSRIIHKESFLITILLSGTVVIIFGMGMLTSGMFFYQDIPSSATLDYRTVEPGTGGFLWSGSAQYYIFDIDGNRYLVSQSTFDSYEGLPRK